MLHSHPHHSHARRGLHVAAHILRGGLLMLILSLAVMLIWNRVVPELFHLPILTYGKAMGLTLLCRILFGARMTPPRRHFRFQGGEGRPPRFPWQGGGWDQAPGSEGNGAR